MNKKPRKKYTKPTLKSSAMLEKQVLQTCIWQGSTAPQFPTCMLVG